MILAVTGHRPDKLGGYDDWEEKTFPLLCDFAADRLKEANPSLVLTGLALGFDQAVAEACIFLDIPYWAAVPFAGQERKWSVRSQLRYRMYVSRSAETFVVSDGGYAPWKMHARNEWMVDRSDRLLALFDGGESGGTFRCAEYARKKGKPVDNCWKEWTLAKEKYLSRAVARFPHGG